MEKKRTLLQSTVGASGVIANAAGIKTNKINGRHIVLRWVAFNAKTKGTARRNNSERV